MTIPEQKTQMSFARLLTPKNLGTFPIFRRTILPLTVIFAGKYWWNVQVLGALFLLCYALVSYHTENVQLKSEIENLQVSNSQFDDES